MSSDEAVVAAAERTLEDVLKRSLENFKGTYFYEKKVSDGNYGSDTHGIHVQFDYAPDATPEEFLDAAREAAFNAKSIVFEQAGIAGEIDSSGILHEVLRQFPGAVVEGVTVESVQRDPADTFDAGVAPDPPHDPAYIKTLPKGDEKTRLYNENSDWAAARFAQNPSEFWDNRGDKKYPNSHDYAHKTHKGVGFWVKDNANA